MSFVEQERALFDLLFDRELRELFMRDRQAALGRYELSESECGDFAAIRPAALALDAQLRADMLLQYLCRALPLTFSITSALPTGLELARNLIDAALMRSAASERVTLFARRLRSSLLDDAEELGPLHGALLAVSDAELAMTTTSEALKQAALRGEIHKPRPPDPETWLAQPVQLAPYVCAVLLPLPYAALKRALCPVPPAELWKRLSHAALPFSRLSETLARDDPRLLVARAEATLVSRCEATVDQRIAELSAGFVPLFAHVNGTLSVRELLSQLKHQGAPDRLLHGVHGAFKQLLDAKMIETVDLST
jgi:hypothetical protein